MIILTDEIHCQPYDDGNERYSTGEEGVRSMAKLETKEITEVKVNPEDSSSLKGTLYAVFGIGIFLVITWLIVFSIFLERN